MIALSRGQCAWVLGYALVGLLGRSTVCLAQAEVPEVPAAPPAITAPELPAGLPMELPEGLPPVEIPKLPEPPKLPGPLGDMLQPPTGSAAGQKPATGTRMRLEIDHRKQAVILPRLGVLYTLQPKTLPPDHPNTQELPPVTQSTLGVEVQVGLRRTVYLTAEAQALYIVSGGYGLGVDNNPTLLRYGEGTLTLLTGAGVGRYTQLLDSYQVWSRIALKGGYLHPYYGLLWLNADLSREFKRTPQHYWEVTVSPSLGLLLPLDARGTELLQRVGFLAGAQLSAAFIFAPLGG